MPRRDLIGVALCVLAGLGLLVRYTYYLLREDLREWQVLRVEFEDVGGLKVDDEVRVRGTRLGRVGDIRLQKAGDDGARRQLVLLEVEPEVVVHQKDHLIQVVSTSSLGFVAVQIEPGDPSSPPIEPGQLLEGELRPGLGGGDSTMSRRRVLRRQIDDLAAWTGELRTTRSGLTGSLLNEPDQAHELDQLLRELHLGWAEMDSYLGEIARGEGGPGALLASRDALLALGQTVSGLRGLLVSWRGRLRDAAAGRGLAGRLLGDPQGTADLRLLIERQRAFLRAFRRHEGTLGRLDAPATAAALDETLQGLRAGSREADERGTGLLGALSHPSRDAPTRAALRGGASSLGRLARNPAVSDPNSPRLLGDSVGELDDMLRNLNRGLGAIRHGLPDRSSFMGAVFAVF